MSEALFDVSPDTSPFTAEERTRIYAELEAKNERERAEEVERRWLDICPKIYNAPIDYSKIDPKNHAVVRSIIAWDQYPKGMFIIGPTGRAKTRAAWAALKPRWLTHKGVYHATSYQLAQDAVKAVTDHEKGHRVIPRYVEADILFLDDLGKRLPPSATQFLFEVIERRTSNDRPIVVTSNETPTTLAESINDSTMSEPIIRRLKEFCDLIVVA